MLCLLIFYALSASEAVAQTPVFSQLTDEDGLPGMTIYNLLQDRQAYIWLGTDNGLCRFEGTTFKVYNSPLLKGNEILQTYEHSDGKIFFHNLEGQLAYIENEQIHLYKPKGFIDTIGIRGFEFTEQALWIHPSKGGAIVRYSLDSNELPIKRRLLASEAEYFLFDKDVLIGSFKNKDKPSFSKYSFSKTEGFVKHPLSYSKDLFAIKIFLNKTDRHPMVSFENSVCIMEKDSIKVVFKSPDIINQLSHLNNQLCLLTNSGLKILDSKTYRPALSILEGITTNSILLDKEGNLWIGTADKGLYFIPSLDFQVYQPSNSSFPTNRIHSIFYSKRNNKLLVGQAQGYVTVLENGKITKTIKTRNSGRVTSITQDQRGDFYLGNDRRLQILDSTMAFSREWSISSAKYLFTNQQDNLIICNASSAVLIFSGRTKNYVYKKGEDREILIPRRSYAGIQAFSGTYWLGTTQGLFTRSDTLQAFTHEGKQPYYSVNTILQGKDSTIWVGTQSDGLIKIKNNRLIAAYTKASGLVSNKVKELYLDADQTLWIGTDKGLQIMSPQAEFLDLINKLDGLPSNDITAMHIDSTDVWLGTPDGLVNFKKKNIHKNPAPPAIQITGFNIWDKDTTLHHHYDLDHHQNNLSIVLEGIAFRSRGTTRYQYRMLGVDSNWVTINSQTVRYPTLNPGDYRFEAVALNEDDTPSDTPAVITLSISPPWWKTIWFITLAILGSIGLITSIFYLRIQHIRRREEEKQAFKEQMNELKMQALQVQMNPHFVFNALNAIQKYLTTNEQEQAMIYLARFARLIRLIFEQSKKKEILLEEEFEFLKLYLDLEKLRFHDKVDIQFIVDEEVTQEEGTIKIPPLLIQPVLENAFKHGLLHKQGKGLLKIRFSKKDRLLVCIVEDNGVGREKAKTYGQWKPAEYHSSGLETTRQRLAIFNDKNLNESGESLPTIQVEDLQDKQANATGTRITIHMNIKSFHQV